jgi:putative hemolysin
MLTVLGEHVWHLVAMALLLGASAFFSLSETALFNLTRDQLRRFRASASPLRRTAAALMEDPRRVLVTVLFGTMVVNIAFFVLGVELIAAMSDRFPPAYGHALEVGLGMLTLGLVILFGEIIPKSLAAAMPERLAPLAGPALAALGTVAAPIRTVLGYAVVVPVTRVMTGHGREEHSFITRDELQAIVAVAEREGAVSTQESDMLTDILELGDMKVREVMKPRVEIAGCDVITPMSLVLLAFRQMKHSKMIAYESTIDNIVGVVYAKTAFLNPEKPLAELVRPVYYVPEMKTVESLLKDFRARKIQFAVVVDEYGGVAGLVSLEDCLEQIVGDIQDETDRPTGPPVERLSASEYLLAGNLSIRSWADELDLDLPTDPGRYSTLAGFVTTLLGRMPRPGDTATWRNLAFRVEEVRRRRVTRVRLRLSDDAAAARPGGGDSSAAGQGGESGGGPGARGGRGGRA